VQLLKSLFCLQGFDNRPRFFAINSAIYIFFLMLTSAFSGSYVTSIVFLLFFSIVLTLTSLRRLHDAKLSRNWLLAPSISFTLVAVIIIFSEQYSSYYLLIIPILCSGVLLTYPSITKKKFILGYSGPIDLTEYQQENNQSKQTKYRIEPTLISNSATSYDKDNLSSVQVSNIDESYYSENSASSDDHTDIGEMIRLKLLNNKKAQIIIVATIAVTLLGVLTTSLINYSNSDNENATVVSSQQAKVTTTTPTRSHPLDMPDNYTLYLSEHSGISINWQADAVNDTILWSQITAKGDESCKEISFNKGKPIRTLTVQVSDNGGNNTNYFADFSPLDSKELIQALAFRGNFTLCGYDFSLKGSQAALGKNMQYAQWVEY
jgi:uncharacterized membrane protein YhaH (DUF805 family)